MKRLYDNIDEKHEENKFNFIKFDADDMRKLFTVFSKRSNTDASADDKQFFMNSITFNNEYCFENKSSLKRNSVEASKSIEKMR